jgi:hypothetical protein
MEAAPKSIFANLAPQDILNRLAAIKVEAEIEKVEIPEGTVRELFMVLEAKLPEVGLAIEEIPAGDLTPDAIEEVLKATEAAIDARNPYLPTA